MNNFNPSQQWEGLFVLCTFLLHSLFGHLGVFFLCRLTAAQVSFLLVFVKDCFYFVMELAVYLLQLCGYVLMYRAFAYPEFFCRRAHSCVIFYYIMSEYDTSFLISFPKRIFLQLNSHPRCINLFFTLLCPQGVPRTFPFSQFMRTETDLCMFGGLFRI